MPRFIVEYTVRGRFMSFIDAADKEEAEKKADAIMEDETYCPELDEVTDWDCTIQEMHSVIRDGKPMSVTRVLATDVRV